MFQSIYQPVSDKRYQKLNLFFRALFKPMKNIGKKIFNVKSEYFGKCFRSFISGIGDDMARVSIGADIFCFVVQYMS